MSPPTHATACYLEIGQSSLRALHGEDGLELPLERLPNGRLSANSKQNITLSLQGFVRRKSWQPRTRVYCAISARGVSLRRLDLPATTKESLQRVLLLQLENEFPVPPDELAWGARQLGDAQAPANGPAGQQRFLIAAVKKDVIEEYAEVLSACGVTPLFTLAALAREAMCPASPATHSILDIGRHHSELISIESGVPQIVRILPWGGESLTHAIEQELGVTHDEAEKLKIQLGQPATVDPELARRAQAAIDHALDSLARLMNGHQASRKLYLTGRSARTGVLAPSLARKLPAGGVCESLEPEPAAGRSAAILGLRAATERGDGRAPLIIRVTQTNGTQGLTRPAPWKWVALAASLVLAIALLPFAEAVVLKPYLARKLAALKADRGRLGMIDGEFGFLQYLKQNQPPYLDALYLLAKSAPPGTRIESLSMNRRGDLSLRASLQNSQQVTEFRGKLIDSGFFERVTLEEQAPIMNQPKVNVRISAQWKQLSARQTLALGPTAEEIEQARTRPRNQPPGMPPMMGMPMPMMGPGGPPNPMASPPRRGRPAGPSGASLPPGVLPPGAMPPGAMPPGVVIAPNR